MSSNAKDNNRQFGTNTGYDSSQQQPEVRTPAQYDSSHVGDGGQQDHHPLGGNQRNTNAKDTGYPTTGSGTNNNQDANGRDEVHIHHHHHHHHHPPGGNQRNTDTGYNTTGQETDNQHGHTDEGHDPLGGNQRNAKDTGGKAGGNTGLGTDNQHGRNTDEGHPSPLGGNQRNTNVKDAGKNTGFGTDNQHGRTTDEGHPLGGNQRNTNVKDTDGNQRNTNVKDTGGNQRNTNVKDRVVGKVERALGGNTTKGTGADNQSHPTNGRSGEEYPPGGNQSQGGVKPSMTDKIVGGVERALGGNTTKGTGANNQSHPTNGRSGEEYPPGGNQSQGGVKPSMADKIVGGVEKVLGKVTDDTGLYQEGKARAAGETAKTGNH